MANTKRIIGIGDIHGRYDLAGQIIKESIQFNPAEDVLVFLGDYIDFRPLGIAGYNRELINSRKVVEYLSDLREPHPDRIILLKGNHEALAEKYFSGKDAYDLTLWIMNGADETIRSFGGLRNAERALTPFIKSLRLYYQTPYADFVHANVPKGETLQTATEDDLLWDRGDYYGKKLLVTGHNIRQDVLRLRNRIFLDTGAFYSGQLSAIDIRSGKIYRATSTIKS